jgi:hypothetical protein
MKSTLIPPKLVLSQLEEALEERQTSDRRKNQKGLPEGIAQERRKGDRRTKQKAE